MELKIGVALATIVLLTACTKTSEKVVVSRWMPSIEKLMFMDFDTFQCPEGMATKISGNKTGKAKTCVSNDGRGELKVSADDKGYIVEAVHTQTLPNLPCNAENLKSAYPVAGSPSGNATEFFSDHISAELEVGNIHGYKTTNYSCKADDFFETAKAVIENEVRPKALPSNTLDQFPGLSSAHFLKWGLSWKEALKEHDCTLVGGHRDYDEKGKDGLFYFCPEKGGQQSFVIISFKDEILSEVIIQIFHNRGEIAKTLAETGEKDVLNVPERGKLSTDFYLRAYKTGLKQFTAATILPNGPIAKIFREKIPRDLVKASLNETFENEIKEKGYARLDYKVYLWSDPTTKSTGSALFRQDLTLIQFHQSEAK